MRQLTPAEIVREFGNPKPFIRTDGTIGAGWERKIMGAAYLPAPLPLSWDRSVRVSRFKCHKRIAALMTRALAAIYAEPFAWITLNDFGGCYAWRPMRTSRAKLSLHCWAIAIDLDVRENQQGDRTPSVHPWTVEVMEAHGFLWGGRFGGDSIDPMHFEFSDLSRIDP